MSILDSPRLNHFQRSILKEKIETQQLSLFSMICQAVFFTAFTLGLVATLNYEFDEKWLNVITFFSYLYTIINTCLHIVLLFCWVIIYVGIKQVVLPWEEEKYHKFILDLLPMRKRVTPFANLLFYINRVETFVIIFCFAAYGWFYWASFAFLSMIIIHYFILTVETAILDYFSKLTPEKYARLAVPSEVEQ